MKRLASFFVFTIWAMTVTAADALPAFPGAEGFGKYAVGGRYGSVYRVTNLNDSGTGSLRDAVSTANRIIIFDVSGVIKLNSRLVFKNNLYVAGQTAPGEGITVYGNGVSFSGASNTIVRYLRFRMGSGGDSGKDAAGVANGTNIIFDHLSVSWGLDETFSISSDGKGALGDITIQNSIMSQGLMTHSAGGLMQADHITLYRNLYVDNSTRNNKIKGTNQYVNNIVYNWKNGCYIMGGDSQGTSYCNATNNLFINGPAVGGNAFTGGNSNFNIYADDNWQDKNRDGILNPYSIPQSEYSGPPTFQSQPYDYPALPAYPGNALIDSLLPTVGASLPYRDPVDFYVINETMSFGKEGALISKEAELPIGIPTSWPHQSFAKPVDTDGDGMPDAWETANGTDPTINDAMTIAANGYANIENYINSITIDDRAFFLRRPFVLSLQESSQNQLVINWFDYTEGEDGFIVEQLIDGNYTEVARILAADYKLRGTDGSAPGSAAGERTGSVACTVKNLMPATAYSFRVRAFKTEGNHFSEYSSVLEAKTQPEYVPMVEWDSYEPDLIWNIASGAWNFTDLNWGENVYTDSTAVLLTPSESATITIDSVVSPKTVVVGQDHDLTLAGAAIAGEGTSVNKFGKGKLDMGSAAHTYTGATALHSGVLRFATLKNGGENSSIGASQEFAQNWIWDGGCWEYTGGNTSTNRSAKVYQNTIFNISSGATVTMTGTLEGTGGVTVKGGQISVGSTSFFGYEGPTRLENGGSIYLSTTEISKVGLGKSSQLILAGGKLSTKGESNNYETYSFPIHAESGTYSYFAPNRNCSINNVVTGDGTIEYQIPYVREYICKSWDGFTGKLIARGMSSSSDGSQLMLYNGIGIPNAVVELRGNTRVICWKAAATYYLGGLSGASGTYLSGASKNTRNTTMTWIVGGANTDETFWGVIDNRCSAANYDCTTHIQKVGTGDWRLAGTSIYSGSTTVNGGRLVVNGSLTGNGAIAVNNGGTLCGKGSVKGRVTVNNGGKVAVGDTLFNKSDVFTLNGGLNLLNGGIIQVPLYRKQILNNAARIKFAANSTLNGTLELDMTDVTIDIPNNSSFTVFTFAPGVTLSGSISAVEPAEPSETQEWDLSELFTTGKIYVREKGYTALPQVSVVPVSEQYFSLEGLPLGMEPPYTGSPALFIVKKKYQDGSVRIEKVMVY